MKVKIKVYEDKDGWWWEADHRGRTIARSADAYPERPTMVKMLKNFLGFGGGFSEDRIELLKTVDEVSI
jgi:hypothetical protein